MILVMMLILQMFAPTHNCKKVHVEHASGHVKQRYTFSVPISGIIEGVGAEANQLIAVSV